MAMSLASSGRRDVHRLGRQLADLQQSSIHAVWREARRQFGARSVHDIDGGVLAVWLQDQVALALAEREKERQHAAEVWRVVERLSDEANDPIAPTTPPKSDITKEAR